MIALAAVVGTLLVLSPAGADRHSDQEYLRRCAADTWKYFQTCRDPRTQLIWDHAGDGGKDPAQYTIPTNIALDLCCQIAAVDLGLCRPEEASSRVAALLKTLETLKKSHGFFLNSYDTQTAEPLATFVSFVDNGWLSLALLVVRQTFPGEIAAAATKLLDAQDYGIFYDAKTGLMFHGYHTDRRDIRYGHYDVFCSEPRAASLYAICKGDVIARHWFRMERAKPAEGKGYRRGVVRDYLGVKVPEGYYRYRGLKVCPSWGGSMFEFLMPTLFIDEMKLAPRSLGVNDGRAVDAQIAFARELGLEVWGMSPCASPAGGYSEYGAAPVGVQGYSDSAVTPHASFLALALRPREALENLRQLEKSYPVYGEFGFRDSVDPRTGEVAQVYLALDQAMTLLAIDNFLNKGAIRKRVMKDPLMKGAPRLLGLEEFY